ncbi:hypothetical protein POM88_050888 [Heracleum sosnowskyi]|uniref:Reverse transcriptase zinc-binding domain-containing protein n=1 Tax=Heracleum sosnowskyi TaxID=360622 RepID=A0AAD8M2Y1_9APIA|nr:hypothetical protein POM88_050888 [Heracleum sosnowskyi]
MELSRSLTTNADTTIWNNIWNLVVPPKVKNLIWCALSHYLPMLAALYQRHVQVNVFCRSSNVEDEYHVFVACSVAKSVWSMSNVGDHSSLFLHFLRNGIKLKLSGLVVKLQTLQCLTDGHPQQKNGALNYTQDPLTAEALSCRKALSWLKDKSHRDVLLESDSQLLVYAIQNEEESDSMIGWIIG